MVTRAQPIKKRTTNKPAIKRTIKDSSVYSDSNWKVCYGELEKVKTKLGRPYKVPDPEHLFRVMGEKLPFNALLKVKSHIRSEMGETPLGVYVAHDSMGCPRYVGRGNIFDRLQARKKTKPLELEYFSFYVVKEKKHEREIETLLIRMAGFLLEFNEKKKRIGIEAGSVIDFEAGTLFYQRKAARKKAT